MQIRKDFLKMCSFSTEKKKKRNYKHQKSIDLSFMWCAQSSDRKDFPV